MKAMKTIITIVLLSITLIAKPQNTSGIITYEVTTALQIDMDNLERQGLEAYADMIPKSTSSKKQLYFTEETTLYNNLKEEPKESKTNGNMITMFSNPDNKTYINQLTNAVVEQKEFMGKMFLINDTLKKINWKITGETKLVLNYPCIKASYNDSTESLEAWFTTEIPISIGPEMYGQLPGLILEVNDKNSNRTTRAIDVIYKEIEPNNLPIPSEGKKVSRKKFDEIVQKKMEEMSSEFKGSKSSKGGKVMIIQH
jgi:GLPGLI family protein